MEMTRLLKKWEAIDGEHQHFISDGIIDIKKWDAAPRKVLFLLKEAYDNDKDAPDWDLCELIRDEWGGAKHKIWWTAAYWSYGLHHYADSHFLQMPSTSEEYEKASQALLGSAVVNIKKSGGKSSSNMDDIERHAKDHKDLLWEQIELINPDIVICGGTWGTVYKLWGEATPIYDRISTIKGRLFVDCYHPANQYAHMLNYYSLMGLIHGARLFQ